MKTDWAASPKWKWKYPPFPPETWTTNGTNEKPIDKLGNWTKAIIVYMSLSFQIVFCLSLLGCLPMPLAMVGPFLCLCFFSSTINCTRLCNKQVSQCTISFVWVLPRLRSRVWTLLISLKLFGISVLRKHYFSLNCKKKSKILFFFFQDRK